jgi:hypothetical protein
MIPVRKIITSFTYFCRNITITAQKYVKFLKLFPYYIIGTLNRHDKLQPRTAKPLIIAVIKQRKKMIIAARRTLKATTPAFQGCSDGLVSKSAFIHNF